MGRHIKEGLSYFPLEVDFFEDEKVQFVSARFGVKGDGIIVRILCKIYRQGYAIKFDDDVALLFARSVGDINLHGLVKDVVNELLKRDFFDEGIFKRFGLLTSKGIQKRYVKICTDAKRKDSEINAEVDLLQSKHAFTPEEIVKTPEESTQSKVKESKEKKSKVLVGQAHTNEQLEFFKNFETFIEKDASNVGKMKEAFTIDQFFKLKEKFTSIQIKEQLLKMHNHKPLLQKNISAYLTFSNWSKNNFNKDMQPIITTGPTAAEIKAEKILNNEI